MSSIFNAKKNILLSVISTLFNTAALAVGYRLVIADAGLEDVGLWGLAISIISYSRFLDVSSSDGYLRLVALKKQNSRRLLAYYQAGFLNFVFSGLFISLPIFILVVFNADVFFTDYEVDFAIYIIFLASIIVVLRSFYSFLCVFLRSCHLGYLAAYVEMISASINLIFVLILVPDYGIKGIGYAAIIQLLLSISVARLIIYIKLSIRIKFIFERYNLKLAKMAFRRCINYQGLSIINGGWEPLVKLLFSSVSTPIYVGLLEVCLKIVVLIRSFIAVVYYALLPQIVYLLRRDSKYVKSFMSIRYDFIVVALFALASLFTYPLTLIVFDLVDYEEYKILYSTIVLSFCLNVAALPSYTYFIAIGRLYEVYISVSVQLFILVVAVLLAGHYDFSALLIVFTSMCASSLILLYFRYFGEKNDSSI